MLCEPRRLLFPRISESQKSRYENYVLRFFRSYEQYSPSAFANVLTGQPTPSERTPLRNKGLIAGLKGTQWLISPDHKAGYSWGGGCMLRRGWVD